MERQMIGRMLLWGTLSFLICALLFIPRVPSTTVKGQLDEWFPWVPNPDQVELSYWESDPTSYVEVSILTGTSGYNFTSWGTPAYDGNNITVDVEVLQWRGATLPVVSNFTHMYDLGNLVAGEYVFNFTVWAFPVKDITFIVFSGPPVDPSGVAAGGRMPLLS